MLAGVSAPWSLLSSAVPAGMQWIYALSGSHRLLGTHQKAVQPVPEQSGEASWRKQFVNELGELTCQGLGEKSPKLQRMQKV